MEVKGDDSMKKRINYKLVQFFGRLLRRTILMIFCLIGFYYLFYQSTGSHYFSLFFSFLWGGALESIIREKFQK